MILGRAHLNEQEQSTLKATVAFLSNRLLDVATIDWALRLKSHQRIERLAIEHVLSTPDGHIVDEVWASAWRLVEESWSSEPEEDSSLNVFDILRRIRNGDRSGVVISRIVNSVEPWLKVSTNENLFSSPVRVGRRPKSFHDLLSAKLSSGELLDVGELGLAYVDDVSFLNALVKELDSAVNRGVDIAKRLGWGGRGRFWRIGELSRINYIPAENGRGQDPDQHHRGIAPSVKLLYAMFLKLSELSKSDASLIVQGWKLVSSAIHIRLWSAAARDKNLVSAETVGEFLLSVDDQEFWGVQSFPEISELRAFRFADLSLDIQLSISKRIRRGPPRDNWQRSTTKEEILQAKTYWAVREFKRIQLAGGSLPPVIEKWVNDNIGQFGDLGTMEVDSGFPKAAVAYWVKPNPDSKFDSLEGFSRLRALETDLATSRGWNDDPAERANDWIQQPEKVQMLLDDLEKAGDGGDEFKSLWNRFGWAHRSRVQDDSPAVVRNLQIEANRVLTLLEKLSKSTRAAAIEGISAWLDDWKKQVIVSPKGFRVWHSFLPFAIDATNRVSDSVSDADLSVTVRSFDNDDEPMDLDTLNTPVGRFVGVFLEACPRIQDGKNPFRAGTKARKYRDAIINVQGRSGLIVLHRLIEHLPYFLLADRQWAQQYLISPLLKEDARSLALWRAIARRTHYSKVLGIIGDVMCQRVTDARLGRETRRKLMFSLVVESLHSFRENRPPAVPHPRVQQVIRSVEDEIRVSAASAVSQFVKELSADKLGMGNDESASKIFISAAEPFLKKVWPQERSLVTPGVSGAFAKIPAVSGNAFVEAVDSVERFLIPFNCWSMIDYGLYGDENGKKKMGVIDSESKAKALLRLLDLTIDSSASAVIPFDLTEALDQIQSVGPKLTREPIFRRLSTVARR